MARSPSLPLEIIGISPMLSAHTPLATPLASTVIPRKLIPTAPLSMAALGKKLCEISATLSSKIPNTHALVRSVNITLISPTTQTLDISLGIFFLRDYLRVFLANLRLENLNDVLRNRSNLLSLNLRNSQ